MNPSLSRTKKSAESATVPQEDNSHSDPYASKTKLHPLSETLSSLRRSILLRDLILPTENICT